jgi:hypothetical protein
MSKFRRPSGVTDVVADEFFRQHLPYEIDMLRGLYVELSCGEYSPLTHNAIIESFHIHARNLIEFVKNKTSCDFDTRLFTELPYEPNGNFINLGLEKSINQQISHLTTGRKSVETLKLGPPQWAQIGKAIEAEIERFEKALKPEFRAKWKYNQHTYIKVGASGGASSEVVAVSSSNHTALVEGSFPRITD